MSDADHSGASGSTLLCERVDDLLRSHVHNLDSPSPEEVHRLVYELEASRAELEAKNRELLDAQRRLVAYRDRYVDLYDSAPLGYVTLDEDGFVQEINLAGARLLNVERDGLIGYPFAACVVREDEEALLAHVRKCVGEHREVVSELRLMPIDGQPVAVQLRSIPVSEPEMQVTLCKTAITDISGRLKMENALQQERNLLRTLLDHLPDYIYVKDTESRFLAANLAVAQLMGAASPGDLLGKTDRDFYPEPLAGEYSADEAEILRSGQPLVNKDEPHVDPAGNRRIVLTTKVPFRDSQGQIVGLVGISRDITERTQAEEELRRAQQQLLDHRTHLCEQVEAELAKAREQLVRQSRLAAVGQMSASIVRDLEHSVFCMRDAAFRLRRHLPKDQPHVTQYMAVIDRGIDAAKRMLTNLAELSRGREPQKQQIDLGAAVREVFERLELGGKVHLQLELKPQPFFVEADPAQFRQVLENVIVNAQQAMSEGGQIRIAARPDGPCDLIVVEDDGPGVPPEHRGQLFEPMFSTKPHAAGLGLSICRQIIERHGGSMDLLSSEGRGAAFHIRLPQPTRS